MRAVIFFALLLLTSYLFSDEFRYYDDYYFMGQNFFPADEGDEKEAQLINYIEEFCTANHLACTKTKIDNDDVATNSYNLEVVLPGLAHNAGNIILACPLDSVIINQQYCDVSLSHMIALQLLLYFQKERLDKNLIVLFSGANGRKDEELWGIKQYVQNRSGRLDQAFVMIIDLLSNRNAVQISGSSNKKAVPSALLKIILDTVNGVKGVTFSLNEIQQARFNVLNTDASASYFTGQNIVTVRFANYTTQIDDDPFDYAPYYSSDKQHELTDFFQKWVKDLDALDIGFDRDYNYQVIKTGQKYIYISEYIQVLIYLIIIIVAILIRKLIFYFRNTVRHLTLRAFPYYIFLFLIFYALSFIPMLLWTLYRAVSGTSVLLSDIPIIYFITIFAVPLFIVTGLLDHVHKFPFPRHNLVYMHGAIFFLYLNLAVITLSDISLSYVFLCAILMLILSHITGRNFVLKYGFYLLSAVPFIATAVSVLTGEGYFIRTTFDNPYLQHFVFCGLSYPFFLLCIRVNIINRAKLGLVSGKISMLLGIFVFLVMFFAFYLALLRSPYRPGEHVSVVLVNDYDADKADLTVSSNVRLGQFSVQDNAIYKLVKADRAGSIPITATERPYQYRVRSQGGKVVFSLESIKRIERIDAVLLCPKGVSFANLNYRYVLKSSDDELYDHYKILIPRNPGKKSTLQCDLISGYQYKLALELHYNDLPEGVEITSMKTLPNYYTVYKETVLLDNKSF